MTKKAFVIIGPGAIGLSLAADAQSKDNSVFVFGNTFLTHKIQWEGPNSKIFHSKLPQYTAYPAGTLESFETLLSFDYIKIFYCLPVLEPMPQLSPPPSLLNRGIVEVWFMQNGYIHDSCFEHLKNEKIIRALVKFGCRRTPTKNGVTLTFAGGNTVAWGSLNGDLNEGHGSPWPSSQFTWEWQNDIRRFEINKFFVNFILFIGSKGMPVTNGDILKHLEKNKLLEKYATLFFDSLLPKFKVNTNPSDLSCLFKDICIKTSQNINSLTYAWHTEQKESVLAFLKQSKYLLKNEIEELKLSVVFPGLKTKDF